LVEDGTTVTLGADDPEVPSVVLRPLTTAALLVTCGILTTSPARLSDRDAFEELDTTEGYVDVKRPGPDGRIGGYTPSFLRRILSVLDPEAPVPESVRLDSSPRGSGTSRGERANDVVMPKRRREFGALRGLNSIEMPVPSLLGEFSVVTTVPSLINIVVGVNSTLYLGPDITQLMVNDFLCYEGARVLQQSDYLAADIYGTLMGGLREIVYRPEVDELIIEEEQLAQLGRDAAFI
jgi:hypothetical protein